MKKFLFITICNLGNNRNIRAWITHYPFYFIEFLVIL